MLYKAIALAETRSNCKFCYSVKFVNVDKEPLAKIFFKMQKYFSVCSKAAHVFYENRKK